MFNLFKKKYKRSDWYEGLLFAEQCIQTGMTPDDNLIFWNDTKTMGWAYKTDVTEASDGVCDYLDYYENNLK